jgi:branched-chain amino acid transport system substrate-binding protein
MYDERSSRKKTISRRRFIQSAAALAAAPAILKYTRSYAANPVLKIGYVSPQTGPLAGFGEADDYT